MISYVQLQNNPHDTPSFEPQMFDSCEIYWLRILSPIMSTKGKASQILLPLFQNKPRFINKAAIKNPGVRLSQPRFAGPLKFSVIGSESDDPLVQECRDGNLRGL